MTDFKQEVECDYKSEHYSVRNNGSALRHARKGKRLRKYEAYKPPTEYQFLDQKRKMKLVKRIRKNIAKFELNPEVVEFCNSLNISSEF